MSLFEMVNDTIQREQLPREAVEELISKLQQNMYTEAKSSGFYRTVLAVEILHDKPTDFGSYELSDIAYEITEGDSSGQVSVLSVSEVDEDTMTELAVRQGSDPQFFGIGEED